MSRIGLLSIHGRDRVCTYVASRSGEYTLAWSDASPDGSVGGYRLQGEGCYALLRDKRVVVEGRMERPNDGRICDVGTFALTDWRFGNQLRSTFHVIDASGRTRIRYGLHANALRSAISNDGRFAAVTTANSPHEDAHKVFVFDTDSGELRWAERPEPGVPDGCEFATNSETLLLSFFGQGRYAFAIRDGTFLDKERWEQARLEWSSAMDLYKIGRDRLEAARPDQSESQRSQLERVIQKAVVKGKREGALAHARAIKLSGDYWERRGNSREALKCFEKAASLHPRAGVKGRIVRLRREMQAT